jgi:putative transcriptional regulator
MVLNNLKQWRERWNNGRGISKAHLARQVGVCPSYITKLEQGKIQPSCEVMFRIAEYFKCKVEDVFQHLRGGEGNGRLGFASKHD